MSQDGLNIFSLLQEFFSVVVAMSQTEEAIDVADVGDNSVSKLIIIQQNQRIVVCTNRSRSLVCCRYKFWFTVISFIKMILIIAFLEWIIK